MNMQTKKTITSIGAVLGSWIILFLIVGLIMLMLTMGGCTTALPSTSNSANAIDTSLVSNTGQNFQVWPDGSIQAGATQLDSGVITADTTNWQGTAVSGIMALTKNGVQVKNPGNLSADNLEIVFGDPYSEEDGTTIVPIASISIVNLTNEVTTVIEASSEQVSLWVGVLSELSEDQRAATLAALERDKAITAESAGLIRAALEALAPVP